MKTLTLALTLAALVAIGCGDPGTGAEPESDFGTLAACNTVNYGIGPNVFITHFWEMIPATPGDVFQITYCGSHLKTLSPEPV
jgi:hypothetical protein